MTTSYPTLPDLEIAESTKHVIDQQSVDRALHIIYKHRPDLFAKIAEKEKQNVGIEELVPELDDIIRNEVRKEINIPTLTGLARIKYEARRRARAMYRLPL